MSGMSQEQEFCSRSKEAAPCCKIQIFPTPVLTAEGSRETCCHFSRHWQGQLEPQTPNLTAFRIIGNVLKVVCVSQVSQRASSKAPVGNEL